VLFICNATSHANPGIIFSIPGFGIEEYGCDLVLFNPAFGLKNMVVIPGFGI